MKNFQQPKEKSKETICGGSVSAIEDMIMKGRNLNEIIESTENKDQKHNLMQLVSFNVSLAICNQLIVFLGINIAYRK